MKISDVRIRLVDSDSKLKAIASVTIEDYFVVHDIKIIEGKDNLFIAMPSRKTKEGEYKDIAHPINTETRNAMSETILEAYHKALSE
ncbi:MAG TPA: septation regulator SpoVG [Eubacteriales bacterium]|nr:septation regulator SpoVG [Clostridia bacterium]HRX13776.1 septation regulator SpoVG [Eubacteriales bacterium]